MKCVQLAVHVHAGIHQLETAVETAYLLPLFSVTRYVANMKCAQLAVRVYAGIHQQEMNPETVFQRVHVSMLSLLIYRNLLHLPVTRNRVYPTFVRSVMLHAA